MRGGRSQRTFGSMLRRRLPAGFIVPAQPVERDKPPVGAGGFTKSSMTGFAFWFAATARRCVYSRARETIGATASRRSPQPRPGGNVTGIAFLIAGLGPKQIEMLHEAVPNATVIGFLVVELGARPD